MMRRREFISLFGCAVAAWPVAARAQQAEQMRRIGVLLSAAADDPDGQAGIAAFSQALQQLGWAVGGQLRIDTRWGQNDEDLERKYAAELVALKPDIIVSAIAVSVLLLIYYTAVGFAVIYLTTVFGFSVKNANGLGNWNWGFNVIAVILVGIVSDYFRVRKPFMVLGGVLAAVMTVIYLEQAGRSSASWCSSRTCSSRW